MKFVVGTFLFTGLVLLNSVRKYNIILFQAVTKAIYIFSYLILFKYSFNVENLYTINLYFPFTELSLQRITRNRELPERSNPGYRHGNQNVNNEFFNHPHPAGNQGNFAGFDPPPLPPIRIPPNPQNEILLTEFNHPNFVQAPRPQQNTNNQNRRGN